MTSASSSPPELVHLSRLSAHIGGRIDLVQGPGGNTSQKIEGCLWIKGSGVWLSDAGRKNIFVPIELQRARGLVEAGVADLTSCVIGTHAMRPSIETAMHALLAPAVVIHTHSVNTLTWAVRSDGRAAVASRLDGLRWGWLDYVRPGPDLATALGALLLQDPGLQVVVLGNHGLLVAADTVEEAELLMELVEERVAVPARAFAAPSPEDLGDYARTTGCRMPSLVDTHSLARDPLSMRLASEGAMYPDHAVFLGGRIPMAPGSNGAGVSEELLAILATPPYCAIVPGRAVVLGQRCTPATEAMLAACALVAMRLDDTVSVTRLAAQEIDALRSWDLEKLRQQNDRSECTPS